MESLDDTTWDVLIAGTGLPQSLLALALSRSGKKILHVDRNDYYGGNEAALSLQEAEEWAKKHSQSEASKETFSHASVQSHDGAQEDGHAVRLSSSRAYSLALAPQILYARSILIPALVSSRVDQQIEFQAVGSFFVLRPSAPAFSLSRLMRVPSSREDIFRDNSLNLKSKRALMKFLRFVQSMAVDADSSATATEATPSQEATLTEEEMAAPFPTFLQRRFGLPIDSHSALLTLTLSTETPEETNTELALKRLERHMRSIGIFGAGFAAVIPKWGGLAELAQVACRACAVGGGVYYLGKGVQSVLQQDSQDSESLCKLELDGGDTVTARWLVGSVEDLPYDLDVRDEERKTLFHSVSIVSSTLSSLFPLTSEGGVRPACAVVAIPGQADVEPPVLVCVHSSESGECPSGQTVLYASSPKMHSSDEDFERLERAVTGLLQNVDERSTARVLWRMQWAQSAPKQASTAKTTSRMITLPQLGPDLALADDCLEVVKKAWQTITGEDEAGFLRFEAREKVEDNE